MKSRMLLVVALAAYFAWSCGHSPTGGGEAETAAALAGGGRLAADDPIDGRQGSDSGGITVMLPNLPAGPDSSGDNWRVFFHWSRDCANQPGEQVITDSATWAAWWNDAHSCFWRPDSSMSAGVFDDTLWTDSNWTHPHHPDTMGHGHPGTDTSWTDTIPPGGHGNPWEHNEFEVPIVDFSRYVMVTIRVEYDSGSFCMRHVNILGTRSNGSELVINYEVSQLASPCCDMIMAPMIDGAGSPVIAVIMDKPTEPVIRFERTDTEHECWVPNPDDPTTLDYTFHPCNPVQNEQLITDDSSWELWYSETHGCDTIRFPYPDTMLWIDSLGGTRPGEIIIVVSGAPPVDFSRHAVIILSAEQQMQWGGGIWLNHYENSSSGATAEYTVTEASIECPPVNMPPGHMTHTTAIRVLRPTNDQITWRKSVRTIDCDWASDSSLVDPM